MRTWTDRQNITEGGGITVTETVSTPQMAGEAKPTFRTKLIEVALPLEAINKESTRAEAPS
jgi:hypothetical protein